MKLSAPAFRLKRQARVISRNEKIPLHAALDSVARREGYRSWSLLVSANGAENPALGILSGLSPGDLLLLGARPRQGKTLMALKIALEAMLDERQAVFFSLEYTKQDIDERLAALSSDWKAFGDRLVIDCSDAICANHMISSLDGMSPDTLVVVDYLQLLDQKRENPDLASQIQAIRQFAIGSGMTFVFISQIDRSYESTSRNFPSVEDVRLPNPLDLGLFSKTCFMSNGKVRFARL